MKIISKKIIYLNLIAYFLLIKTVDVAKILCCFPFPYLSHQTVFRSVTERLADLGHELTVITPMPHETPYENIQDIDIKEISIKWRNKIELITHEIGADFDNAYAFKKGNHLNAELADEIYSRVNPLLNYNSDHFDLIIIESCFTSVPGWAAKFKAPLIYISTLTGLDQTYKAVGSLTHPLIYHDWIENNIVLNTFNEKLYHIYEKLSMNYQYRISNELETAVIRKHFGNHSKSRNELQEDMALLVVNSNPLWDSLRPKSPLQIYAPAFNLQPPNAFPNDLQEYLDSSDKDVIYVGFGSEKSISDLPRNTIDVIFKVLESIPYNILLKGNGDITLDAPRNVRFEKWLPQRDLLYHPKVKLFITHCGLHSIDEAIAAKVPMVAIPMAWDQISNSQKIEIFGLGIKLSLNSLNYMELREAILEVADDRSMYRHNIIEYAQRVEDFQHDSLDSAVYWINYVLKHGTDHMKSAYVKTSIVEYYLLDVLAVFIVLILITLTVTILLLKILYRKCFGNRTRSKNHFL